MATTTTQEETQPTWPQLLGSNNWEGLLDPLNLHLRNLILRCGDFIQTTYDAFNNDQNSIYCGSSRYGKSSFFHKVMLHDPTHYNVACFLYATARVNVPEAFLLHSLSRESWDRESNWIGYIAVTSDEVTKASGRREIYVVWRGTTRNYEWIDVFGAAPESAKGLLSAKSLKDFNHGNVGRSNSNEIMGDYIPLTYDALDYANGLPLAIKVLGSFLYCRDIFEWRSALARLRENPRKDIMHFGGSPIKFGSSNPY